MQAELDRSVGALRDTTRRAIKAQEASVDASYSAASSLKFILQRLAQEKVSENR